jgi:hypothetical protein
MLLIIVTISCVGGILIELKNARNGFSIFSNIMWGYGVYTVIGYFEIKRSLISIVLCAVTILSVLFAVLVMCRRIKNRKRICDIIRKRLIKIIFLIHGLVGIGMSFIMIIIGFNILFGSTIMKSDNPEVSEYINDRTLANNMETIVMLRNDTWETLTVKERLNVLQAVANVEQQYLGIPNELNVGTANLEEEGLRGYYSYNTHEIVIDLDCLLHEAPDVLLDAVCHEAFHSYEYCMVEAYNEVSESNSNLKIFRSVVCYANEFENYISSDKDFCSYYEQQCESDARDYAAEAVSDYYARMEKYLNDEK